MVPFIFVLLVVKAASADYWNDRIELVNLDGKQAIGASIILNEKEQQVNEILMNNKYQEFDDGFKDPHTFLPSQHFFKAKRKIEKSAVFDFIRKMPKGASLHSHDAAMASLEFLYNLTFRENLYGCIINNRLHLQFFGSNVNNNCQWKLMKELRSENSSFDSFVKTQLSIIVADPNTEYPCVTDAWARFMQTFGTVFGLLTYRPVFQDYFYQVLKELFEDNVMYLEFRGILPEVYELNETIYNPEQVIQLYINTLEQFKKDFPDFHGARFIYAPSRTADNQTANDYVKIAEQLKRKFPDFIAGFDLVGQEDLGKPLVDFIPQLLNMSKNGMKFFFHAAETDWHGTSSDMNLFDAVLLNTTRIGHGFGIVKHPVILQEVLKRQIAIEISPISNQVLKLVDDLRNHPASFLFSSGFPVVITCDDPTFWDAEALSYDWFLAFMGFASRDSDLRLLKQLAINSIKYSAMEDLEKAQAFEKWEEQWQMFLNEILIFHQKFNQSYNVIRV